MSEQRGSLDLLPASTLGQYHVRSRIGSGGMGDVYDAVHTSLDKRVAIKTLRRRFLDDEIVVARFLREGQLASRMRHPNIVDVTDCGVIDGLPCLVMEHLEGETLGQVIRRDGAMSLSTLVDLLLPIVAAVDFAHDHGVLHRDLKPSNIFLARSWNGELVPKVLDFGISKLVSESADAALTTDSAFVGTPHYASPESVRAEKAPDRRTDQYSMGVILYEGSTGQRPYVEQSGSFLTMAMAICKGECPPPRSLRPDLPEAFERVVLRAMALRADDRFLSMRLLGEALLPFASERARIIWAPAFANGEMTEAASVPHTQVLSRSGVSVVPHSVADRAPSMSAGGGSGGTAVSPPWAASGSVRAQAIPAAFPSMTPVPASIGAGMHGGSMPPMSHDRTPSFGHGVHSSVHAQPQKQSPAALLLALTGIILAAVVAVGIFVSRQSARTAAAASDGVAAAAASASSPVVGPLSATFTVNVHTTPENAVLELDGVAVGTGRFTRQLQRDGQRHVLRISAPGHETVMIPFDDAQPPAEHIALRANGAASNASPTPRGPSGPVFSQPKPGPGAKPGNKPDRPRTDNIDPWE